mmetsp:Transcript_2222/g.4611  ORF Transcript_2222/g.4611 Transcript_2222/m.4611 type:complete len:362 (+) Transcript_2222:126-1211(+)
MTSTNTEAVWSPGLRKIMAGVAGVGAVETGYLTYAKLFPGDSGGALLFCGSSQSSYSSCDQVLNGPYSNLPFFENLPLASLGFVAYSTVVALSLRPLLFLDNTDNNTEDVAGDRANRVALTALATSMGTFSIFLMTLLFGVLQTSCPYCVLSAACSFLLANIALIGGCLPEPEETTATTTASRDTTGGKTVAAGFLGAVVGALVLFGTGSINTINDGSAGRSTLLATTISGGSTRQQQQHQQQMLYAPPEITTESSERALNLAKTLREMDAKMYGAHWCSHCYDQKQILGKQVFDNKSGNGDGLPLVEYVECSKDGIRSQSKVCKAKEIPGYPTWEIQGKLYPGQQEIDELEDLVKGLRSN